MSDHKQPLRSAPRLAGFTLVEAMLALAILSIGIFVLVECTARCLAVIRASRNYQNARLVMDQGELDHPLVWTNDVEENTVESEPYPNGYTFSRTLTPMEGEESLYLVTTRVTWSEVGKASFEEVIGVLYCPKKD
jgi:Tfp pilus assembly protein PilE